MFFIKRLLIQLTLVAALLFASRVSSQYNKNLYEISKKSHKELPAVLIKELKALNQKKFTRADKALYNTTLARYYESTNQDDIALQLLLEAKKTYKAIDSTDAVMETNLRIYIAIYYSNTNTTDPINYLRDYTAYIEKKGDKKSIMFAYTLLGDYYLMSDDARTSKSYYNKALELQKVVQDPEGTFAIYNNMSQIYSGLLNQPDSAIYYLKKNIPYLEKYGTIEDQSYYLSNMAGAYTVKKEYGKAIALLLKDFNLKTERAEYGYKQASAEQLYKVYKEAKDYKNAFKFQELAYRYRDSMKEQERNIAKKDIDTRYRTREKELENKVLKADMKANRMVMYVVGGISAALIAIGFLIVKNARRKEKISVQEKLIEQQKLEKALKDHELQSIDIMLEGQERERQRIANDLHDNLGSMLATLKLNFENLKMRKNGTDDTENLLFERTDGLIDEAYHKVRRLAHGKNAGVLASEGLIPALEKLTEKISIPGKLELQFIPYGFTKRLDNQLEITIFRTLQELSTNIIKHSRATEATVQLTHHEDCINIIIEDNGVGFNPESIQPDGMGLDAIKKKIAQLNGTLEIDSTPGKGTTIIIDIPV
ncbi:MAG: ATP-binding protein [Bacteroidia bacterium]